MKGLQLCKRFFQEEVSTIVESYLGSKEYAAGLISYGSDVLGHDDEYSRDHEWGPRCTVWLSDSDYIKHAEGLYRAISEQLPVSFLGFSTRYKVDPDIGCLVPASVAENGMHHIAITSVSRNMSVQYGLTKEDPDYLDWLCIPEQKLLELTRGEIFHDPIGDITRVRKKFSYFPDEVWRFKLLYAWESLNGLDVVRLCFIRGETLSARIILQQLVERVMRVVFLLNRRYCPGTMKWFSKEFYLLPKISKSIGEGLEKCLIMPDLEKAMVILEEIVQILVQEHNRMNITSNIDLKHSRRKKMGLLVTNMIIAIRESLSPELSQLEIQGGIDQWITNDDILCFSENFTKFRHLYEQKKPFARDGIGDRMV
jgi:hypothetical protein